MADEHHDVTLIEQAERLDLGMQTIDRNMRDINRSAAQFGRTLSVAFAQGVSGSRRLDDVLKSLYPRLSDIALRLAFKPAENALTAGFAGLFGGSAGGIIGTPSYFPSGGGLASGQDPQTMPLQRVATGGRHAGVTVNIATPDAESFRRSELYVTGQIARAVARGQRGL